MVCANTGEDYNKLKNCPGVPGWKEFTSDYIGGNMYKRYCISNDCPDNEKIIIYNNMEVCFRQLD